ncbi:hypothetical protein AFM18_20320 [Achromobacter spanius]|uniref:Uncharacterized protein n=1 Tax=Achromobacter spanius TaxID=217203 RepID=A0AAW3I1U7_9BURK|nr:hypothetical protein AFM18_20320 [Achromobacter spanius]
MPRLAQLVGWVQRGTVMPRTHNADRAEPILQWLLCGKAAEELGRGLMGFARLTASFFLLPCRAAPILHGMAWRP